MEILFSIIKKQIIIVPYEDYCEYLFTPLYSSPDFFDIPYLALAMKLRAYLWTNDKALKKQDFVKGYCYTRIV